jgi:hypothetical protein
MWKSESISRTTPPVVLCSLKAWSAYKLWIISAPSSMIRTFSARLPLFTLSEIAGLWVLIPHAALAIATVPYGLEAQVEETLYQMMCGACDILRDAGCGLAGGHTSEGS